MRNYDTWKTQSPYEGAETCSCGEDVYPGEDCEGCGAYCMTEEDCREMAAEMRFDRMRDEGLV